MSELENESFESEDSDEDFCPENEVHDNVSEEDTDDDNDNDNDNLSENEAETKKSGGRRNQKPKDKLQNNLVNERDNLDEPDEEEKKHSDSLWASFLGDVNSDDTTATTSNNKPLAKNIDETEKTKLSTKNGSDNIKTSETSKNLETTKQTVKITEVLEFAGEEIKITKELSIDDMKSKLIKNGAKTPNNKLLNNKLPPMLKRSSTGGLSSILGQIGKKTKLSVLEKTKMDWQNFKQDKGLEEELRTHNKGKDGYLERQDFLQRTDLKQFEIEKNLRQSKRNNN